MQEMIVEYGFELEERARFLSLSDWEAASEDPLDAFGGRVAETEVDRWSMVLDTFDGRLTSAGITTSLVLHSGFERPSHKIVLKDFAEEGRICRETTIRLLDPVAGWARILLDRVTDELSGLRPDLGVAVSDLRQVAVLRQRRLKRTVIPSGSLPVFLTFDAVSAYDLSGSIKLGERFWMEAEVTGSDPSELLSTHDVSSVVDAICRQYHAERSASGKGQWARGLAATSCWRESPLRPVPAVPQTTTGLTPAAARYARFLSETISDGARKSGFPRLSYSAAMTGSDAQTRDRVHRAHFAALRTSSGAALRLLKPALAQPAVMPMRRAFRSLEASSALVSTMAALQRRAAPSFHRYHAHRRAVFGKTYGLADVQVAVGSFGVGGVTFEAARMRCMNVISGLVGQARGHEIFEDGRVDVTHGGIYGGAATLIGGDGRGWLAVPWSDTMNACMALAHEGMHAVQIDFNNGYLSTPTLLRESVARIAEFELVSRCGGPAGSHWALERWRSQFFRPLYQTAFEVRLRDGTIDRTAETLGVEYRREIEKTYGGAVEVHDDEGYEWVKGRYLFRSLGLLEYPASFLIGAVLHSFVTKGGDLKAVLQAGTIEDLCSILAVDLTTEATYEEFLMQLDDTVNNFVARVDVP